MELNNVNHHNLESETNTFQLMKYKHTNNGFCRSYYQYNKKLYCLQASHENPNKGFYDLLVCTKDGEPSHIINHSNFKFEYPTEDSLTDYEIRTWLDQNK